MKDVLKKLEECKKMLQDKETPVYEDHMAVLEIDMAIDWLNKGVNNPAKIGNDAISTHIDQKPVGGDIIEAETVGEPIDSEEFDDDNGVMTVGELRDLLSREPDNKPLGVAESGDDDYAILKDIVGVLPFFPDGVFRFETKDLTQEEFAESL